MADFVNAKFDAEKHLAPVEVLNMSPDAFKWVQDVGIPVYREVQRGLVERKHCGCTFCCMTQYQRANAVIARLANEEATNGKVR